MWRSTVFSENENSDQSISEDDDLDGDSPEDHVSLGIPAEEKVPLSVKFIACVCFLLVCANSAPNHDRNRMMFAQQCVALLLAVLLCELTICKIGQGKVQILSQLDMLRDANEVMDERHQTSFLPKRQADICIEDDVEFPIFSNKTEFNYTPQGPSSCNSDEEILSDNEVEGNCMQLSKHFTSDTGNCEKIEPCSFRENRKDGICTWLAANTETDADCAFFHPIPSRPKRSCKGGQGKPKHKFSFRTQLHNDTLYQDEHDFSEGSTIKYNKTKSTSEQLADKKSILATGHVYIEDDPDCLGSDSSSEEDEENHQIQVLAVPGPKQKTIADQFHEALGENEEGQMCPVSKHTGFGLFGKLQRVMHSEKERDTYFLSKLQKEDEASCLDVRILSKSLEGKLTVCSCSCIKFDEGKNLTIIFSSRICDDVELDVGILIRIHPPWKEVNVKGKQEKTILSTYFSQI